MTEPAPERPGRPARGDPAGPARQAPNGRLTVGLVLIGTGRASGFAQFGASTDAFLATLAPSLGLLIVLTGLLAWAGQPLAAVALFLIAVCSLLIPAVIADGLCVAFGRRGQWAHYANVLNCSQWLIAAVVVLLLPLASATMTLGLSKEAAGALLLAGTGLYALWFHWFAARHALDLSRGRAVLAMLAVVFGTLLALQLPSLLTGTDSLRDLTTAMAPTGDTDGMPHGGETAAAPQ